MRAQRRNQTLAEPAAGLYLREDAEDGEDPLSLGGSSSKLELAALEVPAHSRPICADTAGWLCPDRCQGHPLVVT